MIYSEGYKAFRGTMRIVPKNSNTKPYELTADWLYKPEYQCWYGCGNSFPEEICEVVTDMTTTLSFSDCEKSALTSPWGESTEIIKPPKGNADLHLLECPFCGNKEVVYEKYACAAGERWRCWCTECIACIDPGYAQAPGAVRRMWNRRTSPDKEGGSEA